jgi:hypothetical protein
MWQRAWVSGKGLVERLRPWNSLEHRAENEVGHDIEHVLECHVGHHEVQPDCTIACHVDTMLNRTTGSPRVTTERA